MCVRLREKHVLAGLCGHDANLVASLVAVALCRRIDLGDYLRDKARAALSGTDGLRGATGTGWRRPMRRPQTSSRREAVRSWSVLSGRRTANLLVLR